MNHIDRILENVQREIELYGRSGADSIYIDNYKFSIPADQFTVPELANEDEGVNDVAWFFTCARKGLVVPHPNPDRSFWIKFFGKDALPYGPTWNIKNLVDILNDDSRHRQAVLNNAPFSSSSPPCVLSYQFQHLDCGLLDLTVYFRSCDVSSVLPQDAFMSRVILEQIASLAGLDPGKITFMIGNAHVYYRDAIFQEEFTIDYGN